MEKIEIVPYPEEREIEVLKKVNAVLEREVVKLTKTLILRNDELLKAKDALRWRKYPEEKPEDGRYMFKYLRKHGKKITEENVIFPVDDGYVPFKDSHAIYWLPIPPLEDK